MYQLQNRWVKNYARWMDIFMCTCVFLHSWFLLLCWLNVLINMLMYVNSQDPWLYLLSIIHTRGIHKVTHHMIFSANNEDISMTFSAIQLWHVPIVCINQMQIPETVWKKCVAACVKSKSVESWLVKGFLFAEKEIVMNIHNRLCDVYWSVAVDRSRVSLWNQKIKESGSGDMELLDRSRSELFARPTNAGMLSWAGALFLPTR